MKRKTVLFMLMLIFPLLSFGQLRIDWQQCFGGSKADVAKNVISLANNYIVVGYTGSDDGDISYTHGLGEGWIVKMDSIGNMLWEKTYGGSNGDNFFDGFLSYDSTCFYFLGNSYSTDGDCVDNPYPGSDNYWIVKTDNSGNIKWSKMYGNNAHQELETGTSVNDGGVIAFGYTTSAGGDVSTYYGERDMWAIKLDSLGNKDWDLSLGTTTSDYGYSVIQTSDNGFLFAGTALFEGPDGGNIVCKPHGWKSEAVIVKTDSAGNIEWQNCYGGSSWEIALGAAETSNGYLFTALAYSHDGDVTGHHSYDDNSDVWLVSIDTVGNIIWEHCYGGIGYDGARNVFKTGDGGFMVFGDTQSTDGDVVGNHSLAGNSDIWVFKVDSAGNLLWQQCIGGIGSQELDKGVQRISDKEYVIASTTIGDGYTGDMDCTTHGGQEFWVFKVTDTTTVVGLPDTKAVSQYKIYPNPVRNYVILELPVVPATHTVFYIYDIYGRNVATLPVKAKKTVWDARAVKNGVYLYTLRGTGVVKSGKIVIDK